MADAIVSMVLEQLKSLIAEEYNLLTEVKTEVIKLDSTFRSIQAVLFDAGQRQHKEETVKVWLDELRQKSYDVEDLLDKWNTWKLKSEIEEVSYLKKVCSFFYSTFCCKKIAWYHEIGTDTELMFKELDDIANNRHRYNFVDQRGGKTVPRIGIETTSSIIESEIYGRDEVKSTLVGKLVSESCISSSSDSKGLSVISIVGMGGIGKTTLAQLAYNSKVVKRSFDVRGWVCVSDQDEFDAIKVASLIAVALKCPTPTSNVAVSLQSISEAIRDSIVGKNVLLVLDDVWTEDHGRWEPIRRCLGGGFGDSKVVVLVTTRNLSVAKMMESAEDEIVSIEKLSEEHCWSLFKRWAFSGRGLDEGEFSEIGRQIVRKCKGLPLAAKTMGGFLGSKLRKDEWIAVLNDDLWNLEGLKEGLFPPLLLSYNDLPQRVKSCFSYCAVFPKDYHFDKDRLIKLWMAQGYLEPEKDMEMIGERYFNTLASRSFFQEFQKDSRGNIVRCKMHDIVHDCAIYLTRIECLAPDRKETSMRSSLSNARHVMLMINKITSFQDSLCNNRKIRSLFFQFDQLGKSSINEVLQELFGERKPEYSLRALELGGVVKFEMPSGTEVKRVFFDRIPGGIGKLIHLRYLDLSENDGLDELPETLCKLYNLQTLNIAFCRSLQKLPSGIGKLVNLRHLINNGNPIVKQMPKGIENLTCLRTLCEFRLSRSDSGDEICTSLDSLNKFEYIRGYILIGGLENIREKTDIDLRSKQNIIDLALEFDGYSSSHNQAILSWLQPPPGLQTLEILHYSSSSFNLPDSIILNKNLKKVKLHDLSGCEHLPPFGKFPSLESLEVHLAKNIRRVSYEFLGIKLEETKSPAVVTFPKLKYLRFANMPQWEEWSVSIRGNEDDQFIIMPSLHSLSICSCRALRLLPNQVVKKVQLKNLEIVDCPLLEEHYKVTGTLRSQILHIPNVRIDNTGRRSLL